MGYLSILKKAFDTVDHGILIKKLKRGVASDWVKSYLSNRKQFVNIDGGSSGLCSNALSFANASANAAFALALAFDSPVMAAFALAFAFDSSAFAFALAFD